MNSGLLPCRQILYRLSHQGSPMTSTQLFLILQRTALQPEWYHIMMLTQPFKDIILSFSYQEVDLPPSESESEVDQSCLTLCDPMDCSLPASSSHGIFPGKNTGVGCHFLLQGIFPTQGLSPSLPHCRQTQSEPPGKPRPSTKMDIKALDLRAVCL